MIKTLRYFFNAIGLGSLAGASYRLLLSIQEKVMQFLDKVSIKKKALVLLYHRVDSLSNDPLNLAVTPEHFDEQLAMLKNKFEIISVLELVERIKEKKIKGTELCITFDDGFRDNLTHALPILEKHQVPATIFVTGDAVDNKKNFPWDEHYGQNGELLYLSTEELIKLADSPLITIGAHTMSHPRLSDSEPGTQRNEIGASKAFLEEKIKKPITLFAYPFGGYSDIDMNAIRTTKEAGFEAAFLNNQRVAHKGSPLHAVPRILVRNWSAGELKRYLSKFV